MGPCGIWILGFGSDGLRQGYGPRAGNWVRGQWCFAKATDRGYVIELAGGVPLLVQLKGKVFKIAWDASRDKITSKARIIIINTPHNPSGQKPTERDMPATIN